MRDLFVAWCLIPALFPVLHQLLSLAVQITWNGGACTEGRGTMISCGCLLVQPYSSLVPRLPRTGTRKKSNVRVPEWGSLGTMIIPHVMSGLSGRGWLPECYRNNLQKHECPFSGSRGTVRLRASHPFFPHRSPSGGLHYSYSHPSAGDVTVFKHQPLSHWSRCLWCSARGLDVRAREDVPAWVVIITGLGLCDPIPIKLGNASAVHCGASVRGSLQSLD